VEVEECEVRIAENACNKPFTQPLTAYKQKEELETLVRALKLSEQGTITVITGRIKDHLASHTELQENLCFEGLFQTGPMM